MRGYLVHRPGPALVGLVDYFWSLSDVPPHARERVIPSGAAELVVIGGESARGGGVVSGAFSRPFDVETRLHAAIAGVHFTPGGATALLGVPAGELADRHVELDALWGRRARELRERLYETADPPHRLRLLEQALLDLLSRRRAIRAEVAIALQTLDQAAVDVGDVAKQVQLSHRRFIALFNEQVGMTPKRYARVRRLQRALSLASGPAAPPWAQVALDCGYFDQAHLCRDWLELTGVSPMQFLRLRRVPVKHNHLALPQPAARSNFSNTGVAIQA